MVSNFVVSSKNEAEMIRDAISCDAIFGSDTRSLESREWFDDNLIVRNDPAGRIGGSKLSGARMAAAIQAIAPFYPDEVPLLMRDLAVAASVHVELSVSDKAGAGRISDVFATLAKRLPRDQRGSDCLGKIGAFLAVENIAMLPAGDGGAVRLNFPNEKPILPRSAILDTRLAATLDRRDFV
jgi:hypothetical protein